MFSFFRGADPAKGQPPFIRSPFQRQMGEGFDGCFISQPKYWSFKSIDGGHLPVGGGKAFPDGFHHIHGYAVSGLLV